MKASALVPPGLSLGFFAYRAGAPRPVDGLFPGEPDHPDLRHLKALGLRDFRRMDGPLFPALAEAAAGTLASACMAPETVDAVLFFTSTFDFYRDHDQISILAARLGLSRALPFGSFLAQCTNFSQALQVARGLLADGGFRAILILGGDRLDESKASRVLPSRSSVFSDAVVSCLVGADLSGQYRLDGICHAYRPDMHGIDPRSDVLRYLQHFSQGYGDALEGLYRRTGTGPDSYARVVLGNHNLSVLRNIAAIGRFPMARVFASNLPAYAHCFAADQFIALADMARDGAVRPGDRILAAGSGGHVFSACAFTRV